jgi:2-keto-4-pentenoate hydratase
VAGLVTLREEVAARAQQAGEFETPVTQGRLNVIDRLLADARALRLKLDAIELRKEAGSPRKQ